MDAVIAAEGHGTFLLSNRFLASEETCVDDSRDGWGDALDRPLAAYTGQAAPPADWDFTRIRPKGARLRRFGGYAGGPEPLRDLLLDPDIEGDERETNQPWEELW